MMEPVEITYRPMQIDHYDAIRQLWESDPGVRVNIGDERDDIARYLQRNPGISHEAWHKDELIGAILGGHDGRRGYIYHLIVKPAYRGFGVGKTLVAKTLASLAREGIQRVTISVLKDNPNGRAFWEKQGWTEVDFLRAYRYNLKATP